MVNKKIYFSKNIKEDVLKRPLEAIIFNIIEKLSIPLDIIVRRQAIHKESKELKEALLQSISIIEDVNSFNIDKPTVLHKGIFAKDNYENNYELSLLFLLPPHVF